MKRILPKPGAIGRKLKSWMLGLSKSSGVEAPAGEGGNAPQTLTQEQVESMIEQALKKQRHELKAEFTQSMRRELESISGPVRELYESSLATQKRLIECSGELRQEVVEFADNLVPRVKELEKRSDRSESAVIRLQGTTDSLVERLGEEIAKLGENIDTANSSFFTLHRATGERIDEIVRDHKADFGRLLQGEESPGDGPQEKSGGGVGKVTSFLGQRLRGMRTPAARVTAT